MTELLVVALILFCAALALAIIGCMRLSHRLGDRDDANLRDWP